MARVASQGPVHWHGAITTPGALWTFFLIIWHSRHRHQLVSCCRVQNGSNPFILGEKQNKRGEISRTRKSLKTHFQVFPSVSDSDSLDMGLREGESLQSITLVYPGLLELNPVARWVRHCRTLHKSFHRHTHQGQVTGLKFVCTLYPPSSFALLLENTQLTHSFNQRSSPRPLSFPPSFNHINILLLFIGRNMQMNVCGKALESSNVNKTSKQGLSSL